MLNPNVKIAKSKGIDLPILHVYLAGRIAGDCIEKCLGWRKSIINYYNKYKTETKVIQTDLGPREEKYDVAYPISFICPLNSGEASSVDGKGLTSAIPANLIYDKDLLSVERADVVVANMEDYFEEDISGILELTKTDNQHSPKDILVERLDIYKKKILTRRENIGTVMEVAWALYLQKPVILIVPERRREIFEKHPFTKRASAIVTSVDQLLKEKWLNILYKSIAGAIYE